ncbi:Axial budding pattern protein 2 [Cyphellophora attinorum]|uniref:Axial budding pattern protein 2 n=1 Tax=Cyphellophora attinorum TaxID=1664694 RepID=A0A0N0NJH3_9EURO|nr:Axial budding pattern protein 2 [Phialophora attinorum]KPI36981.1 Axial budding pattern protein 2 [Phialophora attinorum]
MRRHKTWAASLASFILLTRPVRCAPQVAFPINSQLPPVAYASKLYSFTFADTTFSSEVQPIEYAISNGPQWLSIVSDSRTLRGMPDEGDVGALTFDLSATDTTGTTTVTVTLVVARSQSIGAGEPVLPSLSKVGSVQGPSTLFLRPLTPFSIPLSPQIFSGTSLSSTYYAVSANNSPLPPWIQFDPQQLRVAGSTPPTLSSIEQQQTYGVKIVATDIVGFSESAAAFTIAVANRLFYFQSATTTLNVTKDEQFVSPSYRDALYLDGSPISAGDLGTVQAVLPEWLSLDATTISLSGTPPADFTAQMVTITAHDESGDVANLTVMLQSGSTAASANATTGDTLNLKAQAGKYLNFKFDPSIIGVGDAVSIDLGSTASWLSFSETNMSLYGQVPDDIGASSENLALSVTRDGENTTYPIKLSIAAADSIASSSSSSTVSAATSASSGIATATKAADQNAEGKPTHVLAIILTVILVSLAVLAIILFCLWYRRRKQRKQRDKEVPGDDQVDADLDGASGISEVSIGEALVNVPAMTGSSRRTSRQEMVQTPSKVPQVELPWAPDSLKKTRSRLQKKRPAKGHESFDSNWGGLVSTRSTRSESPSPNDQNEPMAVPFPPAPPPIPAYSPKRKQSLASSKITKRSNSRRSVDQRASGVLSNVTNRRSGLPNRYSNAGLGHGSGILTPSLNSGNPYRNSKPPPTRSSWATTFASTAAGKENKHASAGPSDLENFPFPAPASNRRSSGSLAGLSDTKPSLAGLATAPTKPSLRLVTASPSNSTSQIDAEDFSSRREEYYRTRAKHRLEGNSMLFSNPSSRSRTPSLSRMLSPNQTVRTPSSTFPIVEEESSSPELVSTYPTGTVTNWRKLDPLGKSPAVPLTHQTNSHILAPVAQRPPTRRNNGTPVPFGGFGYGQSAARPISISSGQFSSALSSDGSQWEDEIPDAHSPYRGGMSPDVLGGRIRSVSNAESATNDMLNELTVARARKGGTTPSSRTKEWKSTASSSVSSPSRAGPANQSPRLPFDNGRPSGETEDREIGMAIQKALRRASQLGSGRSRGLRLVDKRKRIISVDGKDQDVDESERGRRNISGNTGDGSSPAGGSSGPGRFAWGGREKSQKGSLMFI